MDIAPRDDGSPSRFRWQFSLGRVNDEDLDADGENPAQSFRHRTLTVLRQQNQQEIPSDLPLLMGRSRLMLPYEGDRRVIHLPNHSQTSPSLRPATNQANTIVTQGARYPELFLADPTTREIVRIQPLQSQGWNHLIDKTIEAWRGGSG